TGSLAAGEGQADVREPRSQGEARLLEERLHVPEELRARRTVERAVVASERELHPRPHDDLALDDDRLFLRRSDREDRRLRRVQHGHEALDAEPAEIRDPDRAAREIALPELGAAR